MFAAKDFTGGVLVNTAFFFFSSNKKRGLSAWRCPGSFHTMAKSLLRALVHVARENKKKIKRAGLTAADSISTAFSPYDIARQLVP